MAKKGAHYVVNADAVPVATNAHSHLALIGDEPGQGEPRFLYGVLRPSYRDWQNSAAQFARLKLLIDEDDESWTSVAERVEVLLPPRADDRLRCPRALMELIDSEHSGKPALLCYVTVTWTPKRLHDQFECARAWAIQEFVDQRALPVLMIQHAPQRRASSSAPHVHLLIGTRRLTQWLNEHVTELTGDRGYQPLRERFLAHLENWTKQRR